MNKDYFNRYRFHEIIQAAERGEDLSKFVPKNIPEADLINNLSHIYSGGSHNDNVVPDFPLNNPELKGLYYGLVVSNGFTKFVFDFKKFAAAFAEYGTSDKGYTLDGYPTAPYRADYIRIGIMFGTGGRFTPEIRIYETYLTIIDRGTSNVYIKLDYIDDLKLNEKYPEHFQTYSKPTLGMIFNEIGRIEIDLTAMSLADLSEFISDIYLPNIHGPEIKANLNEHPIDYMWFE